MDSDPKRVRIGEGTPEGNREKDIKFPLEIFEQIFNHVKDARTFQSIINAKEQWSNLLEERKPRVLFPLVFPCLINYLDNADILTMREVSKDFKNVVDYAIQHGPLQHGKQKKKTDNDQELVLLGSIQPDLSIFNRTTVVFKNIEKLQNFLDFFGPMDPSYNPLPGRAVYFNPLTVNATADAMAQFEEAIKNFLDRFGEHVWRLTYRMPIFPGCHDSTKNLAIILAKVKNLRHLTLEDGLHWMGGHPPQILPGEEINERTLPELPLLAELHIPEHSLFNGKLARRARERYEGQLQLIHLTVIPEEDDDFL